jgi:hypothetical protein
MRRGTQVDVNSGKTKQFRVTTSNVEENFTQVTIVYGELSLMSFLKVNNDAKIKDVLPQVI